MKILLVAPPSSEGIAFSDGMLPPRTLLSLGGYIQKRHSDIEVVICDGNVVTQEDIVRTVIEHGPWDLVGISTHTTLAYENCLQVARVAQDQDSPVVLGGIHVNAVGPEKIVSARGYDVCQGRGEVFLDAYVRYLQGTLDKADVPNLVWRDQDSNIISNRTTPTVTQERFIPHADTLNMLDMDVYRINFQKVFGINAQPWTGYTHEGCAWRDRSGGGCRFCTLTLRHRLLNPSVFWDELCVIAQLFPNHPLWFKDLGDSISGDWDFVQQLIDARPRNVPPYHMEAYLHPGELRSAHQAGLLKELGVCRVFVGFESGDNHMLKKIRKGSSEKLHKNCVRLLVESEIEFVASFVLGMHGETRKSLDKTLAFAQYIHQKAGRLAFTISATPVLPFPGSPLWKELLKQKPGYGLTDNPHIRSAQRDWIRMAVPDLGSNSSDALRILEEYAGRINRLSSVPHSYGSSK